MDARDIAAEIDRDARLQFELRSLMHIKLSYGAAAGKRTEDIVRLLGLDETIRRIESRHANLRFDGRRLTWLENGLNLSWPAISGRSGFTGKEHQALRDTGPIPEGHYIARQSELQRWENYPLSDRRLCIVRIFGIVRGSGKWPGCVMSWGERRVWLEPRPATRTYGRSNFSIHGGWWRGSAGCIDLNFDMPSFVDAFVKYGKDIDVMVRY